MEQHKQSGGAAGGRRGQASELDNGQSSEDQQNRTDETGGGQLTKLRKNAGRDPDREHGTSTSSRDEE